jgi:hypothetical protein
MLIAVAILALLVAILLVAGMLLVRWALAGDVEERPNGLRSLLRRLVRPLTPTWVWRGPLLLTYRRDRLGRFRKVRR